MASPSTVREPAVAGLFYPGDPEALATVVDRMLDASDAPPECIKTPVLLSPHAGYTYSGAVAARGFSRVRHPGIHTVIIIGPSHVEYFDHTSVFSGDAYATPLGVVAANTDFCARLAQTHPSIRVSDHGHVQTGLARGEHGIEVQLPFLQRVLSDASIVPIVMGDQSWDNCVALGESLGELSGGDDGVLIVVSSDLSHFYTYDRAVELDTEYCNVVSTRSAVDLHDAITSGRCEACGAGPMMAALIATSGRESSCEVLVRINSGDVTGDRSSVVGYASAVVTVPGEATT